MDGLPIGTLFDFYVTIGLNGCSIDVEIYNLTKSQKNGKTWAISRSVVVINLMLALPLKRESNRCLWGLKDLGDIG